MKAMTFLFLLLRFIVIVLWQFLGQHVRGLPYFIVQQPNQVYVFSIASERTRKICSRFEPSEKCKEFDQCKHRKVVENKGIVQRLTEETTPVNSDRVLQCINPPC